MESHAENAWKDIMNWHTRRLGSCCKVSPPCLDDPNFKKEDLETVRELIAHNIIEN